MFCSYARGDAEAVRAIAIELDKLGQQVWIDQKLSGGQSWWNTILEQVRTCDCFLLALSEKSLRSKACRAELDYAYRLGRTILPVVVGPVIDALVPGYVAELHRVEAGDTHGLARALLSLSPTPSLPVPLPEPPPVPISYLDGLATQLDRDELTLNEQRILEADLKQRLENPEEREAAIVLLRRLRQHPSITEFVAREVEADLASVVPPPIPDPAPIPIPDPIPDPIPVPDPGPITGPTPRTLADQIDDESRRRPVAAKPAYGRAYTPAPASSRSGGSRTGVLVAAAVAVVLALAGLAIWAVVSAGGNGGNDGNGTDVSTEVEQPGGTDDGGGGGGDTTATSGGSTRTTDPPTTEPRTTERPDTTEEQTSGEGSAVD